jgi:hypothetical protein
MNLFLRVTAAVLHAVVVYVVVDHIATQAMRRVLEEEWRREN